MPRKTTGTHKGTKYGLEEIDGNSCKLTRQSPFDGKETTMTLPVSSRRVIDYYNGRAGMVQNALPTLDASQREFVMTGIRDDEWPDPVE